MTNRPSSENDRHANLIRMMADHFVILGYADIKADLDGYAQPSQIDYHVPDLTATKSNGKLIVLEAETCGTIAGIHTSSKWRDSYNNASRMGGEFHIVVSRFCDSKDMVQSVQETLNKLSISANEIWVPRQ
jgi:hypothetical protein